MQQEVNSFKTFLGNTESQLEERTGAFDQRLNLLDRNLTDINDRLQKLDETLQNVMRQTAKAVGSVAVQLPSSNENSEQ